MLRKNLIWLVGIFLFSTASVFGTGSPIVDCQVSRITVPIAKNNGEVVCAASFMFGEYVQNPSTQADLLNSKDLIEEFNQLSEESRWGYPEYVIMRNFQAWKDGDREKAIACFEPGYSRERENKLQTTPTEKIQSTMEPFTEIVFLDKSYFGPYVRIYCVLSEVPAPGQKGRGLPISKYLKLVNNRYMLTHEINMTHLFDEIVGEYGGRKSMHRENIPLNPDTSNMEWFSVAVDINSPPKDKKMLMTLSTEQTSSAPMPPGENDLLVYLRCEPVNIRVEAGKQLNGLSKRIRFLESAVTAHRVGNESDILAVWSDASKERIQRKIGRLRSANAWPINRTYHFGQSPLILALMQTSTGTIAYYQKAGSSDVYPIGLQTTGIDKYALFRAYSSVPAGLTNKLFTSAVERLYGQH